MPAPRALAPPRLQATPVTPTPGSSGPHCPGSLPTPVSRQGPERVAEGRPLAGPCREVSASESSLDPPSPRPPRWTCPDPGGGMPTPLPLLVAEGLSSVQSRDGPGPGAQGAAPPWTPRPHSVDSVVLRPGPATAGPQRLGGGIQMRPGRAPVSLASCCRHCSWSWRSVSSRQASRLLSAPITSAARRPGPPGPPASVLTSRWGPWGWVRPPPRSQACRRAASSRPTASRAASHAACRAVLHSGPWPPTCKGRSR